MKLHDVIMHLRDVSTSAVERIAESGKTTAAVSFFSTSVGVASFQQWITGMQASVAAFAGVFGVLVLARLNWLRGESEKERRKNERIRGQLLRERAAAAGIEIEDEDDGDSQKD